MKGVYVDAGVVLASKAIWKLAEDRLVEQAIYHHLIEWRKWDGEKKGWCEFPVEWWGREQGVGFPRVKAALEHLLALGIVVQHPKDIEGQRKTKWYKSLALEKGETLGRPVPPVNPNEAASRRLIGTPGSKGGEATLEVVNWEKGVPVVNYLPFSYAEGFPECADTQDGVHRYVPVTGAGERGMCVYCTIRAFYEDGAKSFTHMGVNHMLTDDYIKLVNESVKK